MFDLKSSSRSWDGFSRLDLQGRLDLLTKTGLLTEEDIDLFRNGGRSLQLLGELIESAIGWLAMPLGVAVNFRIDNRDMIIPMVVEETSVVASVNKAAKWVKNHGELTTQHQGTLAIGQIQFPKLHDPTAFFKIISAQKQALINQVNEHVLSSLVARGGGAQDMEIRCLTRPDGGIMGVIHLMIDPCEAMGANRINQACEFLRQPLQELTGEHVHLCILSNLPDARLTHAQVIIHNVDPQLGKGIEEASLFAQLDSYRAVTHNKGIMNGMDAVVIATGNDWRAVEAGVHAYAARSGQYTSLSRWYMQGNNLHGTLTAPIHVGTVGGVTRLHPVAKKCLDLMKVQTATELSRVIAAVGLIQNLAALTALASEGIVTGHMKLHLNNLVLSVGANPDEVEPLKQLLKTQLEQKKHVSESDAFKILQTMRMSLNV